MKEIIKMILYKNNGWKQETDYYEINCFLSDFFKKCLYTILFIFNNCNCYIIFISKIIIIV